jgi:hypothetical protein
MQKLLICFHVPDFTVKVSNSATPKWVIARLNHCKAIEAAYLKPLDEMP